jgi:hypothetical protein
METRGFVMQVDHWTIRLAYTLRRLDEVISSSESISCIGKEYLGFGELGFNSLGRLGWLALLKGGYCIYPCTQPDSINLRIFEFRQFSQSNEGLVAIYVAYYGGVGA